MKRNIYYIFKLKKNFVGLSFFDSLYKIKNKATRSDAYILEKNFTVFFCNVFLKTRSQGFSKDVKIKKLLGLDKTLFRSFFNIVSSMG